MDRFSLRITLYMIYFTYHHNLLINYTYQYLSVSYNLQLIKKAKFRKAM